MKKDKIDHASRGHAKLSASGANRWMNCTPSIRMEEGFADSTSIYAEEGTLAHEFAELNLKVQLNIISLDEYNELSAPFIKSKYYSNEMMEYVQMHVDYVIQQYTEAKRITPDAILSIEDKVDLGEYIEEGFGTCDDIIIADGVLEVIDLKYGMGLRVSAENNPQLKLYGLGAYYANELSYDIHTVKLTIVQPRLDAISTWDISVEDLIEWGSEQVKPKAEQAYKGEGEVTPGDWCKFCKAKPRCRKLADRNLEIAKQEFTDPELLTDSELMEAFKIFPQIKSWIEGASKYILAEAIKGKKWEDHKLVEGRSTRKWVDTDEVEKILKKKKYKKTEYLSEPKILGITKIEKLVGKVGFSKFFSDQVDKPKGAPTVVHISDKRPEYKQDSAEDDFSEPLD